MEMFLLAMLILMIAVVMAYSKEVYMYLVFTLGAIMADIINVINSIIGRKK